MSLRLFACPLCAQGGGGACLLSQGSCEQKEVARFPGLELETESVGPPVLTKAVSHAFCASLCMQV